MKSSSNAITFSSVGLKTAVIFLITHVPCVDDDEVRRWATENFQKAQLEVQQNITAGSDYDILCDPLTSSCCAVEARFSVKSALGGHRTAEVKRSSGSEVPCDPFISSCCAVKVTGSTMTVLAKHDNATPTRLLIS